MDPALDLHRDGSVAGIGVLLALEGFDMAVSLAVGVVDDPGFLTLPLRVTHFLFLTDMLAPPRCLVISGNMLWYVQ